MNLRNALFLIIGALVIALAGALFMPGVGWPN